MRKLHTLTLALPFAAVLAACGGTPVAATQPGNGVAADEAQKLDSDLYLAFAQTAQACAAREAFLKGKAEPVASAIPQERAACQSVISLAFTTQSVACEDGTGHLGINLPSGHEALCQAFNDPRIRQLAGM
jgi:hypothetical protein